jgi:hypothetical protein
MSMPDTHDTQAGSGKSLLRTLLYTRSDIMDSICSNTKNFIVILIVISLGTLVYIIVLSRYTVKINAVSIITGHSLLAL